MSEWFTGLSQDFQQTFIDANRWRALLSGLGITLKITALSLLVGIALGILVAVIRSTHDQMTAQGNKNGLLSFGNFLCQIYLAVIRGTPVMVQLLIMYFVILVSSTNTTLVATLTFGINSGAYVAEIIRSGIMSIDKGQMEAGRSLGISYVKTMRLVIIPQAIKNILPALGNEFIALLKETSIVNVIGMKDITKWALNVQGRTYQAFMPFIGIAVIYFLMVMIFTKLVSILERKLNNG
ncbi:MAG: amino acid ABC transporter permease [Eubacteriales bacterium]|nr:amino acid ABC transporter permease [Eubacteriales bacterium]